ncbi:MAG: hypothetical protein U1A78_30955 [Polyangia bacterium]
MPVSVVGTAAAAEKDPQAQASALYREATELRKAGRSKDALRKLHDAYALVPTPTLLWPIAEVSLEAGEPAEGLDALRRYREQMAPEEMEPGQKLADAERLELRLKERMTAQPNGGSLTGSTDPTAPVPGGTAFRPHPLTWTAVALTGAVLLAATGIGAAALVKTQDLEARCPDRLCLPSSDLPLANLNADVASQHSLSIAAQALWGVGAALAVGTVTLVLVDWKRQQRGGTLLARRLPLSVTPLVGPAAPGGAAPGAVAGVLLGGRF